MTALLILITSAGVGLLAFLMLYLLLFGPRTKRASFESVRVQHDSAKPDQDVFITRPL